MLGVKRKTICHNRLVAMEGEGKKCADNKRAESIFKPGPRPTTSWEWGFIGGSSECFLPPYAAVIWPGAAGPSRNSSLSCCTEVRAVPNCQSQMLLDPRFLLGSQPELPFPLAATTAGGLLCWLVWRAGSD